MRERPIRKLRPYIERCEEKRLLNASPLKTHLADLKAGAVAMVARQPTPAYTLQRITKPTPTNAQLNPPFNQVLVQTTAPVPGMTYNVLSVSMRNSTARTFTAADGLTVSATGQKHPLPVLTGGEQWKAGQVIVFYILTKKYYPIRPSIEAGFQFNFASGIAIPGPSGIYVGVKYDPATFPRLLDWIVVFGPGAKGHELGLPDTALWQFVSAKTNLVPL